MTLFRTNRPHRIFDQFLVWFTITRIVILSPVYIYFWHWNILRLIILLWLATELLRHSGPQIRVLYTLGLNGRQSTSTYYLQEFKGGGSSLISSESALCSPYNNNSTTGGSLIVGRDPAMYAFAMSIVAPTLGVYSWFASNRIESLWQALIRDRWIREQYKSLNK